MGLVLDDREQIHMCIVCSRVCSRGGDTEGGGRGRRQREEAEGGGRGRRERGGQARINQNTTHRGSGKMRANSSRKNGTMHPKINPKIDTEQVMNNHENQCKNDATIDRTFMKIHYILEPVIYFSLQRGCYRQNYKKDLYWQIVINKKPLFRGAFLFYNLIFSC